MREKKLSGNTFTQESTELICKSLWKSANIWPIDPKVYLIFIWYPTQHMTFPSPTHGSVCNYPGKFWSLTSAFDRNHVKNLRIKLSIYSEKFTIFLNCSLFHGNFGPIHDAIVALAKASFLIEKRPFHHYNDNSF